MTKEAKKSKITKSKNSQQLKPQKSSPTDCNKKTRARQRCKEVVINNWFPYYRHHYFNYRRSVSTIHKRVVSSHKFCG